MTIWLTSDHHFGHENILKFVGTDGQPIRPGYADLQEMHEWLIHRWNARVGRRDHVYHLGDFALRISSTQAAVIAARLNGIKRLVRGNHDRYQTRQYLKMGFAEIHGMRLLFDVWLTHAPLHPASIGRALGNVHGHIHEKEYPGPYYNVCVERTGGYPLSLEEVREQLLIKREATHALAQAETVDQGLA